MSSPVDVEESPEISSVGDYKTPLLSHPRKSDLFCEPFGRFMSNDRTFGDYSDASPEKEVGESDKFYGSASQFFANYIHKRIENSLTIFGECKQSKAEEAAHAPFSWSSSLLGTCGQKRELVTEWSEEEIKDYGYTPIHEAASNGDLETLRTLIVRNANECLRRDKHGGTPLHAAARRGRVEALKVILEACPETVKMVTVPGENCFHTAVLYNQVGAVRFLVEWLERNRDYAHLINGKDYDGKTPLHLATSRKQIQTLEVLLTCNVVDVNAMCSGSFTALDILDVLPCTWKIGVEIKRILGQAGAMRARDLANRDANSYAAEDNKMKWFKRIDMSTIIPFIKMGLLLMATLVTTITYQAAFTAAGATLNEGGGALRFFMWFNLLAFFGSLAVGMIVISK